MENFKPCAFARARQALMVSTNPFHTCSELNSAAMYLGKSLQALSGRWPTSYQEDHWVRAYCGGAVISHLDEYKAPKLYPKGVPERFKTLHPATSPLWIVYSDDKSLIDNHSGIRTERFTTFVQQLYHEITIRNFDSEHFQALAKASLKGVREHCSGIALPISSP